MFRQKVSAVKTIFGQRFAKVAATAALVSLGLASIVSAQDSRVVDGEQYIPTIWIDPDGCEHWVMDDGAEGYMDANRRPDGTAVCHRSEICGVVPSDQLFATDRYYINNAGRQRLQGFFTESMANGAFAFLVYGHTDSRASDEYNMRLSNNRANAVADIARSVGASVVDVRGFGERSPRATNDTAAGMQENRRVEIYCLR
ncbi:cell envelope biogenesis protein OmpA [Marivivens niveibacter]|uniref:Cell envelope biogenesis protein OmpA n=1 Tax=Marivivens niveibacter TaxID=1930667 RepID=A0A251WZS1_9RHOB|nr:cell envelope biogenesis protein OmpA [Marivivens niveibacter]